MNVQEVADRLVPEIRPKLFVIDPTEPENGASSRRRILFLPIEELELLL
jgi:hypothetical protein